MTINKFKYTVLGIILLLCLVFLWQLYWLKGLYDSMEADLSREILNCIELANQEELFQRMDRINRSPEEQKKDRHITVEQSFSGSKLVARYADQDTGKDIPKLQTIDQLFRELDLAIHATIDTILPTDLNLLDSLIRKNMAQRNIEANLLYTNRINIPDRQLLATSGPDALPGTRTRTFLYTYGINDQEGYEVHTSPLTRTILVRMSGILVTTFLIMLILGFAFRYLVQTIVRQKTLEEMKADFTNNMTHELKTPIAVAFAATDALLNFPHKNTPERITKYLEICREQLERLGRLVEQILTMSMEQRHSLPLNKENLSLKEVIEHLVLQYKLTSSKTIISSTEVIPEDLSLYADRIHLNNMIGNLIDNAVKYSGDPLILTIRAWRREDLCFIQVKDNGMGIAPEKQKYLFDKFYRVPNNNLHDIKGYGLGLYYVKSMAEKHLGTVSVESTPGKGSVFTIKIPAHETIPSN